MRALLVFLAFAPSALAQGTASVQFMITQRMRGSLSMLGYSEDDINQLQPDRAAAIISRRIKRPSSGMPASWTRDHVRPVKARLRRWLGIYLPISLLGLCVADINACTSAALAVNEMLLKWLREHRKPQRRLAPYERQPSPRQRPRAALYPWQN